MSKKYWIAAAVSIGLVGYWLSDETANASQFIVKQAHSLAARQKTASGKHQSVIEVKQTLTAASLEKANQLAFAKALELTGSENFAQDDVEALGNNNSPQLTQTYVDDSLYNKAAANSKPTINLAVEQQLQTIIYGWELTQNAPINYSLSLEQLFDDPEGDLLTTRIWLENANGLNVLNQGQIMLQGAPKASDQTTYIAVSARDDYHGRDEQAWVTTRFELPAVAEKQNDTEHPLIDGIVYRLETTQLLGGTRYMYEVVYCEAFQFINNDVFYAATDNKTECPQEHELIKVGNYEISDNSLIINTGQTQQIWTTKKVYPSYVQETENYFTTVFDGEGFESYTMQKNKLAMEERLNVNTGAYVYQMAFFDFLIPISGGYSHGIAGNYIFDRSSVEGAQYYDGFDSDLNIKTPDSDLTSHDVCYLWDRSIIAGRGELFSDITSWSVDPLGVQNTECNTVPGASPNFVYINHDYQPTDQFIEGEVYSYILRPLPQYADKVEEIKINMIYHHPESTQTSQN